METLLESKLICHLYEELIDHTTSTWTSINGVNGRKFTSKTDSSKYIFLPAGGYWCYMDYSLVGSDGNYWSTRYYNSDFTWYMYFSSNTIAMSDNDPIYGLSIRSISSDQIFSSMRLVEWHDL